MNVCSPVPIGQITTSIQARLDRFLAFFGSLGSVQ